MNKDPRLGWAFLTNHARVLICIAQDPQIRMREIGDRVGITERAAQRIVAALVDAGYLERERAGRRNRYRINAPPGDPISRDQNVEDLVKVLSGQARPSTAASAPPVPAD
jgi:DNA-binding Lrp family transcriptional regulator